MTLRRWRPGSAVVTAMVGAAVIGAQYVAGKGARDALFLTHFDPSSLPPMIIGTSIFAIVLVVASAKALQRVGPSTYVPVAFAASAMLLMAVWGLSAVVPGLAARILYLQVSGLGPLLGSGFWLMASERFDPRTAKQRFGEIAGAGTLGGLIGGMAAARVATTMGIEAMLPLLALLNVVCAWQLRSLARSSGGTRPPPGAPDPAPADTRSGLRVLADTPYLRSLAALVLLGSMAAIFVDYVFKVQAATTFGRGPGLGRFFALYYAAVSLLTFVIQTFGSRVVLEKLGLALTASVPALTLVAGGAVTLLAPGFRSVALTRVGEAVSRGSLHRSAYELFFTPVAPKDKRAAKAVIDVGVDRSGDIIGAGMIQLLLWLPPARQLVVLISLSIGCSLVALIVASRLTRGYVKTLERSLLNRAVELDLSDVGDLTTRTTMLRTLQRPPGGLPGREPDFDEAPSPTRGREALSSADPEVRDIAALRSRDPDAVRRVLRGTNDRSAALVGHVIPLLAWDAVADDAARVLRAVAEQRVGELIDALVDPNQSFTVRRRLARVFSVCVSQRAVDGLLLGLDDLRFEVRFQCGRSLAAIVGKNPLVRLDRTHVLAVVHREAAVSRSVWEGRRLLDAVTESRDERSSLEALVSDRASQSLAHVFTLLSLALPAEPLRVAFGGLHTTDEHLRGTALEYLDAVLPPDIRERLWPFLEDRRAPGGPARPREHIVADLLRSNQSIMLNLEELKRATARVPPVSSRPPSA